MLIAVFAIVVWRLAGARWFPLAALGVLIARAELWRHALAATPGGFAARTARLAAVWALGGLFLAVLALLLFVTLLAVAYAAASAGPGFDPGQVATWAPAIQGRGRWLLGAVALAGGAGLVFAATRISLAGAASLAGGRVAVLSTWALSRGALAVILIGNATIAAPPAALFLFAPPGPVWRGLQGLVLATVWLPMNVGLMAYVFANRGKPKPDQ
jgi:hypothetical protein